MRRHDLLRGLHQVLRPRTYFEIGVNLGASLSLSRVPTIGVDPFFRVTHELRSDVHLVRTSSDEFFAREHPLAHFKEPVIDLAFIDGMHLSEYALRDFMNTEKYCQAGSVIVLDDMLPRNTVEAGRARTGSAARGAWTGDVFKVVDTLRRLRPDLIVLEMNTRPTGTAVVLLPDPSNTVLDEAYDTLVREFVTPDPQTVPEWATTRRRAMDPERLLASPVWDEVRRRRGSASPRSREAIASAYTEAGLATPVEVA